MRQLYSLLPLFLLASILERLPWLLVLFFIPLSLLLSPYFAIKRCQEFPEGFVKERLENICKEMKFSYHSLLIWHRNTVAVLGTLGRYRYVLFSPVLLEKLSISSLEAILIHEIGHIRRAHRFFYPFITLGASVFVIYLSPFFSEKSLASRILFFFTAIGAILLYFRFIVSFFSRLFEREADLTIFDSPLPCQRMIRALEEVGGLTGTYDTPSLRYYTLRERIHFLKRAETYPDMVGKHRRYVRFVLLGYSILLIAALALSPPILEKLSPMLYSPFSK